MATTIPLPPTPPPSRILKGSFLGGLIETEDWRNRNKNPDVQTTEAASPNRNARPLDLIWPHNQRESDIAKQQNDLNDYFHWNHALVGFAVASLSWGVCFHLWGG